MDSDIDPDALVDSFESALSELDAMSDEELVKMPPQLAQQLLFMAKNGMMPEILAKRIKRLFE